MIRRRHAFALLLAIAPGLACAGRDRDESAATGAPRGHALAGIASWYGPGFDGKPSASGEPFNQYAMTAAHKTLPFGTRVRVSNLDNGRAVSVRINDRGPYVHGRIIDLSYAAAHAIGMLGPGTAGVRIELERDSERGRVAGAEGSDEAGGPDHEIRWFIQVGAFSRASAAEEMAEALRLTADDDVSVVAAKGLHRVRVGPYASRDRGAKAAAGLRARGYSTLLVSAHE